MNSALLLRENMMCPMYFTWKLQLDWGISLLSPIGWEYIVKVNSYLVITHSIKQGIDQSHKSHNALSHMSQCAILLQKWALVHTLLLQNGALLDICSMHCGILDRFIGNKQLQRSTWIALWTNKEVVHCNNRQYSARPRCSAMGCLPWVFSRKH